jgi:hypothetical protein
MANHRRLLQGPHHDRTEILACAFSVGQGHRDRSALRATGMRMTEQRRVIARVLAEAEDHP